ncbi:hypothetical protein [Labilithrix luteola]|nr:hypothetical protein [Labilithrix luteola]
MAEPSAQARAERLFEEGRALLDAGRFQEACPKLEESERLDAGGGTRLNLALCHERTGRLAAAYADYEESLGRALHDGRADRERFAREHLAALEPRIPTISIVGASGAILVDGVELHVAEGARLRVDPGVHVVVVPGGPRWTISLAEGEARLLNVDRTTPGPKAAVADIPATRFIEDRSVAPLISLGIACVGYGVATWGMLRTMRSDDSTGVWALGIGGTLAIGGTLGAFILPRSVARPRGPKE